MENGNIIDLKSVITEHPQTPHKICKTIRQAGWLYQVGSDKNCNRLVYGEKKKEVKIFWMKKSINKKMISYLCKVLKFS